MCGIIGYTGRQNAIPVLSDGLKKLEYRGYDSVGVALILNGEITVIKNTGRIGELDKTLESANVFSTCGIGHTRWATHGCPSAVNAHPHLSFGKKFAVVHNGIIENCDELRSLCKSHGIFPLSETDTELVAHVLELNYDGDPLAAINKTISLLKGSFAIGVVCTDYPNHVFAFKRRSPLLIGSGENCTCLVSDANAFPDSVRTFSVLADNCVVTLNDSGEVVAYQNGTQTSLINRDRKHLKCANCDGFPHYMLKEIHDQPEALARTIAPECRAEVPRRYYAKAITIIGCGSSYNAAICAKPFLEQKLGIKVTAELASEFIYSESIRGNGEIAVLISQSGETADTIAAAIAAKKRGYKTYGIVNVRDSTLTQEVESVIHTRAGPEISVATTKGFTTQIAAMLTLGETLAGDDKRATFLKRLPQIVESAINAGKKTADFVSYFNADKPAFFIGRKSDLGIAYEGALKLKELSYIPALGIASGELKHGSISLIERGTPVIVVSTIPELVPKTLLSIATVKSRGAVTIGITTSKQVASECDESILLEDMPYYLACIAAIVPLQLLAYFVALALNRDVDKPRNLAKSVTVE